MLAVVEWMGKDWAVNAIIIASFNQQTFKRVKTQNFITLPNPKQLRQKFDDDEWNKLKNS